MAHGSYCSTLFYFLGYVSMQKRQVNLYTNIFTKVVSLCRCDRELLGGTSELPSLPNFHYDLRGIPLLPGL